MIAKRTFIVMENRKERKEKDEVEMMRDAVAQSICLGLCFSTRIGEV